MRATYWLCIACLLSNLSHADCGAITKQLFNIEIGGPRNYLTETPAGLSLAQVKHEWLHGGIDILGGTTAGLNVRQVHVSWHEDRVVEVLATFQGKTNMEINDITKRLLNIANRGFSPDSFPPGQFLNCGDGLVTRMSTTVLHGPQDTAPVMALLVSNSALKKQMQAASPTQAQMEKDLLAAAENGDPRAQRLLGKAYLQRNDRDQGMKWLKLAADSGSAEAKYELGKAMGLFENAESWKWLESAAIQGYDEALSYVSRLMWLRLCDSPFGRRYVDFLTAIAKNAQNPRTQVLAHKHLKQALRFRERNTGTCG